MTQLTQQKNRPKSIRLTNFYKNLIFFLTTRLSLYKANSVSAQAK